MVADDWLSGCLKTIDLVLKTQCLGLQVKWQQEIYYINKRMQVVFLHHEATYIIF